MPPCSARRPARIGRVLLAALLGALALANAIVGDPATARAEDTIGIAGRTATAEGRPDERTRFSYTVDPGKKVTDHYLVQNLGSVTETYVVLATDAYNGDEGAFSILASEVKAKDVGSWVQFAKGATRLQFKLAPGKSKVVPFTVNIPADATPGDHAGALVASVVTKGAELNLDRRIGTRLYVRVSGNLQPALTISSISSEYSSPWWNPLDGTVRLSYTVANQGNIALAGNVSTGVRTWFGLAASGNQGDGVPEVLPGSSINVDTEIHGVAAWGYLNPWMTLSPFVDGDDATKKIGVAEVSRDTVLGAIPWALLLLIGLIAGLFALRAWRRRVDARRADEWIAYTEAEALRKAGVDDAAPSTVGADRDA